MTIETSIAIGAFSLALSGCGTAVTVLRGDEAATRCLRKQKTYCQLIPRIYSELAHDFCLLHAPPDPTGILVPVFLLDLTLSGVFDTACLPYTIYRQAVDGNVGVYWRSGRG
ncbi:MULTISPECIES: YceK/YidQ family lipoprotein [unclassified Pseudomonas]|uniref:YceK/YidQ family lipoprotein n=1 Tax=unclassified Pseudomonas TaxID=196821 RepID=UPI000A1E89BB|nr:MULTISPECIES: YceK/YidQ family lipoprotein [unclassified Pseudomonas]UDI93426.1 YceK/YidQ family lipoprotein [Pseudomonas sp. IAC-BECa141]